MIETIHSNKTNLPISATPSFIMINGVRFYGVLSGYFTEEDLHYMEISPTTLLHLVRHLNSLNAISQQKLLDLYALSNPLQLIDNLFLKQQLACAGSKFHHQCQDPELLAALAKQLLARALREKISIPWVKNGNQEEAVLEIEAFNEKEILGIATDEFLGTQSVVSIVSGDHVFKKWRGQGELKDQIEVNMIQKENPILTNQVIIHLIKAEGVVKLQTIYTGILAPKLPWPYLKKEEYLYSKEWWKQHAFIVT